MDVCVMGGGIWGLAIACALTLRGARVQLNEAARIGAGASGGLVGALAPHAPGPPDPLRALQTEALSRAPDWWAAVAATGGVDPGFARTGRLIPLADDRAVAAATARAALAAAHWPFGTAWTVVPATGDWAPAAASGMMVAETFSARIAPRRALAALAAAVRARGGRVVEGCDRPAPAGAVVWATGVAGLAALSVAVGGPAGDGVKGQAALLRLDRRDAPQVSAPGLHVVPHADGTVAVGSTSEPRFADPAATDAQLEAVLARAMALMPGLADAPVIERWAGVRPRARTRAPLLGRWPGRPNWFVALGGHRIGFGLAPAVAERIADLVLEGRAAGLEPFCPSAVAAASPVRSGGADAS